MDEARENKNDWSRYKILIIDDDQFLAGVYSEKFRSIGHKVVTALSIERAIEKIKKSDNFDAIILDIVMKGSDGFEFLSNIRDNKLAEKSAIIVFSNQCGTEDIEKARGFSIDGYIVKGGIIPSDIPKEVLKIIERNRA